MDTIIAFFKSYVILMLLLLVISYLAPKDSYKKYIQFFVGTWMCILLLKPVLHWMGTDMSTDWESGIQIGDDVMQMQTWQGEEVDIFELFYMDQTDR